MTNLPNIDLNNSRPLDVHKWSEHHEVKALVDKLYSSLPLFIGNKKIRKKHLKVLLIDLYVAWSVDPDLKLAVSRDNSSYKAKSRYNELHISKLMPKVVDLLGEAGLVHQANGFLNHDTKTGRVSRVWASEKLAKEFQSALTVRFGISHHEDRECIILRDENKDDIEYEDTEQTKAMRSLLKDYNALLSKTHIDLDYLDKPIIHFDNPSATPLTITQADKFVMVPGLPRHSMIRSKLRMTRSAGKEKSTSMPKPSRLKSSSTFNNRNALPPIWHELMQPLVQGCTS